VLPGSYLCDRNQLSIMFASKAGAHTREVTLAFLAYVNLNFVQ
jgi:hypothetical protein